MYPFRKFRHLSATFFILTLSACESGLDAQAPNPTSDLETVKAFVQDFRTWGHVIQAQVSAKASEFNNQAETASAAADGSLQVILQPAFKAAINAILELHKNPQKGTNLVDYGQGFSGGTIVKTGPNITLSNGVINESAISMTVNAPEDLSTVSRLELGIQSASLRSSVVDAEITSGKLVLEFATPYTVNITAIKTGTASIPIINKMTVNNHLSVTQKKDIYGANLPHWVTFSGGEVAELYPRQDSGGNLTWIIPKRLESIDTVSMTNGQSYKETFVIDIANASTFVPYATSSNRLESENQWLEISGYVSRDLQLVNLPKALIKFSVTRKSYSTTAIEFRIAYGKREILASFDNTTGKFVSLVTITNQDGVSVTLSPNTGDTLADITYRGSSFATLSITTDGLVKVSYIDGTFEIF